MGNHIYIPAASVPPEIYYPEYGLLYNWYAANDARKITSSDDWVVLSLSQLQALSNDLGSAGNYTTNTVGGSLKETGTTYWTTPNTDATNSSGFNGRGSGYRNNSDGAFTFLQTQARFNSSTASSSTTARYGFLYYNSSVFTTPSTASVNKKMGMAVRLLYVGAGTPTEYVGNDLKRYRVISISGKIYLADNLAETRFRDGSIIPWYGADSANYFTNAEWAALTTAGCAAYNNTLSNVGPGFSFPT